MSTPILRAATLILASAIISFPAFGQNRLVNMVPNGRSGETNQDSEPTLTVDPHNFSRFAGSAFTWDNLTAGPMVTSTAPIYVSSDGGNTWRLSFIVPSKLGIGFPTGDITLNFSSSVTITKKFIKSSWLYGGTLSATSPSFPMTVLRTRNPFLSTLMDTLDTRGGNVDQPHTSAKTSAGSEDKLYVGFNNGWGCVVPGGRTSTVDVSQNGKAAPAVLGLDAIEARNTACQDGFAQVVAPHTDGTVYAAFIHDWNGTPRLVVVRDDNWGIGMSPFSALTDPSDAVAGRFVTPALTLASGSMGQQRLGASNVSIAVDPKNSDRVYVAWGDSNGFNSETIHVRRSINRGVDWSDDLFSVTGAMNPEVAISDSGVVGVLYQAVVSGKWETHLSLSSNFDATSFSFPGRLLASQSTATPFSATSVYIGDYASLVAVGSSFAGIFSASNFPDKANFMPGVKYQREVDWTAHKLFSDATHTVEVPTSIDPFFFEIQPSLCDRIPGICTNICSLNRIFCYPIYDPWWWLKCPMCGIDIFINPGDEVTRVNVFDGEGKEIGAFERLQAPLVEKGVTYTYHIRVTPGQGVGYVLKATLASGKKLQGSFSPKVLIKTRESATPR